VQQLLQWKTNKDYTFRMYLYP